MEASTFALSALMLAALAVMAPRVKRRLELSRAKHASLTGHSKMAKRVAGLLPGYAYDEARFFGSDGAPAELLASDLRGALGALGEISGRVDNERMLDQLFASFCIGK